MSTVKMNITQNRFAQLAKLGEVIFHAKDLANLWQIKNSNTLHTTLKRYTQQGILNRIYKGFYTLKPVNQLDPLLLGIKALHRYAYISTETVLVRQGIIQQKLDKITLISSISKKFSIGDNNYYCRKLADKYLYNNFGIQEKNNVRIASLERAIADLLYFNPNAYFDAKNLIDWLKVKRIQRKVYAVT